MTAPLPASPPNFVNEDDDELRRRVMRRVAWRLIPFLGLLYVFNIIDRANLGFVKDALQADLGMSPDVFSLGYGLFYFGYLLFEVPSNLLLRNVGARRWIARIMISWGIVSAGTLLVTGTTSFYLVRILLGVAEAGFFPGIILYLTYWFPARERAKVVSLFMMAIAVANIFGNPLSGAIMHLMGGVSDLKGWQWLFLLEGLPSVLLGFAVLFCLTDRPSEARWLTPEERDWLVNRMQKEEQRRREIHGADRLAAMFNGRVWLLICLYFTVAVGTNAGSAHFPSLLQKQYQDLNKLELGFLLALPHIAALIGMTLLSIHSDRTGERRGHVAFAALVAAAGWALAATASSPLLTLVGFCLAQMGMMSMLPVFWAIPTAFLSGVAAAGGVALINSVANIGGILGASILNQFGLWSMAGILLLGAGLAMFVRPETRAMKQQAEEVDRE
ncbi:MFS transporter [Zavarzinella formosa]|uniref:MFS transporter n=1 Tax=Zavarzinella formosa TaxID=360055 RepID=UPI0002E0528B|nr:MFS transporter [Zavarzinella formosa]